MLSAPDRFDEIVLTLLNSGAQPYLSFVCTDERGSSSLGEVERIGRTV